MGLLSRLLGSGSGDRPQLRVVKTSDEEVGVSRHESWYVPSDGDKTRFTDSDGLPTLRLIEYVDRSGEGVLRLRENSTGLLVGPTDLRLPYCGILVSNLRGESYHADACRRGDFSPGACVTLMPEPDNPHDPKAVAVYDATGAHHCAYVNKQKARAYLKRLALGEQLEAISLRGTPPGTPCQQVTILVATPEVMALLRSPRPDDSPKPAHLG